MIFEKVSELIKTFPKGSRLLGLDVGKKNIGIAISDLGLKIASPNSNLKRTKLKKDLESLEQIVLDKNIGGLICGVLGYCARIKLPIIQMIIVMIICFIMAPL